MLSAGMSAIVGQNKMISLAAFALLITAFVFLSKRIAQKSLGGQNPD
jgi:hypothetical protein